MRIGSSGKITAFMPKPAGAYTYNGRDRSATNPALLENLLLSQQVELGQLPGIPIECDCALTAMLAITNSQQTI